MDYKFRLSLIPQGELFIAYEIFGKNPNAFSFLTKLSCFVNPYIECYCFTKSGAMVYRKL